MTLGSENMTIPTEGMGRTEWWYQQPRTPETIWYASIRSISGRSSHFNRATYPSQVI